MLLPISIFLTGVGVYESAFCEARNIEFPNLAIDIRTYIPFNFNDSRLNAVDVLLIVVLNVVLTALIAFRLIQAQRRLTSSLPNMDRRLYLGVVAILVESAAPVALVGIPFIITIFLVQTSRSAWEASSILQILFCNIVVRDKAVR